MKFHASRLNGKIVNCCYTSSEVHAASIELNVLRVFSFQPAVIFSFLIRSVRCFDHCSLHIFLNITIHLWYTCYYHCNKRIYMHFELLFTPYVKIYTSTDLHPDNLNIYTLAVKCRSRFSLCCAKNCISVIHLGYVYVW